MQVRLSAEQRFAAAPALVFAQSLDPQGFVAAFRGAGPIPALTRIELLGEPALGAQRAVHSSDGAVLHERITAFEPGVRHAYELSGLRPPLAWLVRKGEADWRFAPVAAVAHYNLMAEGFIRIPEGTDVRWDYVFTLTTPLVWPLAAPLLKLFMQRAMRECLRALAQGPR
ncbi:SRPBCC family protein [Arenimonas sp.]|uniref:SRPBCC family protein n=1 Tax=Arenimonas sp. TaxID=1872635 RepID=UPI0039E4492C